MASPVTHMYNLICCFERTDLFCFEQLVWHLLYHQPTLWPEKKSKQWACWLIRYILTSSFQLWKQKLIWIFCKTPLKSGLEQSAQLLADKVLVSGEPMDKQSYQKHQRLTLVLTSQQPYKTLLAWSDRFLDFNSHNLLLWLPLNPACVQTVQRKFLPLHEHTR